MLRRACLMLVLLLASCEEFVGIHDQELEGDAGLDAGATDASPVDARTDGDALFEAGPDAFP